MGPGQLPNHVGDPQFPDAAFSATSFVAQCDRRKIVFSNSKQFRHFRSLSHSQEREIKDLSGGELQRFAIAGGTDGVIVCIYSVRFVPTAHTSSRQFYVCKMRKCTCSMSALLSLYWVAAVCMSFFPALHLFVEAVFISGCPATHCCGTGAAHRACT